MRQVTRDIVILTGLNLLIVFLWFSKGLIFAGGEEGIPFYDLSKTLDIVLYSWQDVSAGYPIQLMLNRLPYFYSLKMLADFGFTGFFVQAIHFFIIMAFGSISLYFLLKEILLKELQDKSLYKYVPLVGSLFYLLNPFSMTQVWGRGLYLQFFPFALLPFFLLMFILGLKSKNFIYGLLGVLASVFFAGSFGNPSYIFSMWVIILIYYVSYVYRQRSLKEFLFASFYFLLLFSAWLISHMWWIYPFLKISTNQFSSALNNTEENLGTVRGISKDYQLPSLLRLIHDGYFYRDQKYGASYTTPLFIILSWIIPIVSVWSISVLKKTKIFIFLVLFFLFSLFICLGANKPSGFLFVYIFKTFPIFQAFRNPFEKFGLVLTMAYSPFFAVGLVIFSLWFGRFVKKIDPRIVMTGLLILVCVVFVWPIWTSQFAGGIKISPWIKVPEYYKQLDDWLSKEVNDGRMIHLPINPGDGLRYSGWEYPYQGIEPGEHIFTRPSIGKNGQPFKPYYNVLLKRFDKFQPLAYGPDPDISKSEFESEFLFEELSKLNVRYIILHKDIDPEIGKIGEAQAVADYLQSQPNIKKAQSFGKLDVYQVNIPNNVRLIYSPQVKINYSKISPTFYKVEVVAQEPFELYFLENFDSNWGAFINNEEIPEHGKVFSYANRWKIEKAGNFNIIIKYKPQDFVSDGMKISSAAVVVIIFICMVYFIRRLGKK